jgi:hypothetical protein
MRVGTAVAGVVLLVGGTGCAGDTDPGAAPSSSSPTSSISTLSPLPMPDMGPPPGELVADLRQSSRDAVLGRFQVWIGNGLEREINPTRIFYRDDRFRSAIPGERLRPNPSGSERGYPLTLPGRPSCGSDATSGRVTMEYDGQRVTLPVEDEADVVTRYVTSRCFEIGVARVATLTFDDAVATRPGTDGEVGLLVLHVRPSGRPGSVLSVEEITGTPVLTAAGSTSWTPGITVRSDGGPRSIELPVQPARCDGHAFLESGGATAFRFQLQLNGRHGELVVRMSPPGAAAAIGFAKDACGL